MPVLTWVKRAAEIWRAYVVDGNPGSGPQKPVKADIRTWGLKIETTLDQVLNNAVLIGGYMTASAAANSLTIAIKTNAGNDPSPTEPVYADFRSAAAGSGAPQIAEITAAVSFVVSAGSRVGFADTIPGRLWVPLFYDAGPLRLGVFNAYGGNAGGAASAALAGIIYPLTPALVASSTAEGGVGAADSPGVIYTGTAVSSKAFVVLGSLSWETALAVSGNWSAAPDIIHNQRLGDRRPGDFVQRQASFDAAVATGSTITPFDNTIPQSSEGNQFMTCAITPTSKANVLEIEHEGNYAATVAGNIVAALHQDAVVNALVAKAVRNAVGGDPSIIRLTHRMLAGITAPTTFKVRAGNSAAATVTFNGSAGAQTFGGVNYARLEAVERVA